MDSEQDSELSDLSVAPSQPHAADSDSKFKPKSKDVNENDFELQSLVSLSLSWLLRHVSLSVSKLGSLTYP